MFIGVALVKNLVTVIQFVTFSTKTPPTSELKYVEVTTINVYLGGLHM